MFVSKRRIGKKPYFYLESRVDGKRLSVFLGGKEKALNVLEESFDKLVQKNAVEKLKLSQKKFNANILSFSEQLTLERLKIDYKLLKEFFPQGFESFKQNEFVRYAQGSTSVEGNSLSEQQAALVLEKGIAIAGKKIEEIKEIENMKLAAKVSEKISELTEKSVKKIHSAIMNGFEGKKPGKYREDPMFITGSKVKPVIIDQIEKDLKKLFKWLEKNSEKIHPIELAAEFHARFEKIHPFNDGNGRTGRETLNVLLRKNGFPRAIINLENRESYIALLERVQLSKEYEKFSKFVYLCLEKRAQEIGKTITENKKTIIEKLAKKIK